MGRQPFLTRLALGRSPFEPSASTASQTDEYIQLDTSQHSKADQLQIAQDSDTKANAYVQLYDERGAPINPRAHEHGRRFRKAQNDVLSAIGVVERHRSPSSFLPGAYGERLEDLENENSAGQAIALASTLGENACTWWIGSIRDRILTFRFPDTMRFQRIFDSQCELTGPNILYAGFPARLLSTVCVQASIYSAHVFRPLDRLLLAIRATRKTKTFFQRWRTVIGTSLRILTEVIFYPFAYHANLQRLGLIPARPLLPYWRSFIPFSSWSPIRPLYLQHGLSSATVVDIFNATMASPLVFVLAGHFVERWVYAVIFEAIETTVIHPTNPDLSSPDDGVKNKASIILGLRQKSPPLIRNTIETFLVAIGWGDAIQAGETEEQRRESGTSVGHDVIESIEVGNHEITDISQLEIPVARLTTDLIAEYANSTEASAHESVPGRRVSIAGDENALVSPTASEPSQNADDPRIRITSREQIVEMEVRFPHVVSTDTVIAGNASSSSVRHETSPGAVDRIPQVYHRVTHLSTEPAQMIGAICKAQVVGWAVLPLKLITFRLIAAQHLAGLGNQNTRSIGMPLYRVLSPFAELHDLNWKSSGLMLSRLALCSALEIAIDLALWQIQWSTVTHIGKTWFGWGAL